MSVELQRAQLAIILAAVSGIGTVKSSALILQDEADLKSAFSSPIKGCQVDRAETLEVAEVSRQDEEVHAWLIQVVMDINETASSPVTFQTLLEAIRTALRNNLTLNGTAEGLSGPPQVRTAGHRDFGGYLVHYGEISFGAVELVTY